MKNTKNYTVYFEIYGKKMKVKILAQSMTDAKDKVKDKMIFHKIVIDEKDEFNTSMDILDSMFDILDKKK